MKHRLEVNDYETMMTHTGRLSLGQIFRYSPFSKWEVWDRRDVLDRFCEAVDRPPPSMSELDELAANGHEVPGTSGYRQILKEETE